MWHDLFVAVALVMVIEGIMPFANPQGWRKMIESLSGLNDATLRFGGLTFMVLGCLVLYLLNTLHS